MKKKTKAHKITPKELKDALNKACEAIDQFCATFDSHDWPTRSKMDLMDELMIVYVKRMDVHCSKLYHFAVGEVEDEMLKSDDFNE